MIQDLNQFPPIPAIIPKPDFCAQVASPVICLDGIWQILHTTEPDLFAKLPGTDGYTPIYVPSWNDSLHQSDFCGSYIYKTIIPVTPDITASRTILRMEAVNGFASIYINGTKVAEHKNAFLTWNIEITSFIHDCDSFELAVVVDELKENVSTFSHGGLIRSVWLYLLPSSFLRAIHTTTTFDADWNGADLQIDYSVDNALSAPLLLRGILTDPFGKTVQEGCFDEPVFFSSTPLHLTKTLSIASAFSWDAEHPRLYTISLELFYGELLLERVNHIFGFRQLLRDNNRLLVNGKEVKLRGSCRHEVTARNGRCLTPKLIEEDIRLFKEANCNYIRTSHYPPSEYFLSLCDKYGIYVEDEMALAFIARSLNYTQQDPLQTQRYLSHFADLVARDYSHPCILIWSLCNESFGGINFDLLNIFVKSTDPTRVTKFSYPMTLRDEYEPIDIWSIHYSNYEADLAERHDNVSVGGAFGKTMPVIHDEYAHVPCYNRTEQRRDPYVHEFWGQSLAHFWAKIWQTPGALGGAIWAGIDETDIYDNGNTCLEWGIVDIWRRKKTEHYATRKAYSPIVLRGVNQLTEEIANEWKEPDTLTHLVYINNQPLLTIFVKNRFCHTNLSETTVRGWCLDSAFLGNCTIEECCFAKSSALSDFMLTGIKLGNIAPFESGEIFLPVHPDANFLYLEWYDACSQLIDEFLISLPNSKIEESALTTSSICTDSTLTVQSAPDSLTIFCLIDKSNLVSIVFNTENGLISSISRNNIPSILSGPQLHIPYVKLPSWIMDSFTFKQNTDHALVTATGHYGDKAAVTWIFTIFSNGIMDICCTINHLPILPPQIKLRVGVDCGGLDELGFTLQTAPGADQIYWDRNAQWSIYPMDSIGRNHGSATKIFDLSHEFGILPSHPWKDDCCHDILNGRYDPGINGSNDFCAMKPNLFCALINSTHHLIAPFQIMPEKSKHPLHLRAETVFPANQILSCLDSSIYYSGCWHFMTDNSYESSGYEMWSNEKDATAIIPFTGTGIIWYAPVDVNYGQAQVFVDNILFDDIINQRIDGVDFPGSSAGFDKKYHYPVFSVTNLSDGEHTLTIKVLGTHVNDSCDSYIVLEEFYILKADTEFRQSLLIHMLKDYNFPQLSWGNRIKPAIRPSTGETIFAKLCFNFPN